MMNKKLISLISKKEINNREIIKLLKEMNYQQICHLAAQDEERNKEIALWDTIQESIDDE